MQQYLEIPQNLTLNQLRQQVGASNLESILAINNVKRVPNVGAVIHSQIDAAARSKQTVPLEFKIAALNKASQDSDVFEAMALMDETDWLVYKRTNSLPGTLKIPESITLSDSVNIIGNSQRVSDDIYKAVMKDLKNPPHSISPETFNTYFMEGSTSMLSSTLESAGQNVYQYFKIPWGNMSIYSSIADESKDFPVYPEEMADGVQANYTQMPEIIYQYEPWQLFTSSGPRSNTYTFKFHRDMWTGDHRDGKANELIRFCMANCYPEYNGSTVNSALVTLYMDGEVLIRGVLTNVTTNWEGPLGIDNFYLVCTLVLNITEVSPYPLNYWSVKSKPLIG